MRLSLLILVHLLSSPCFSQKTDSLLNNIEGLPGNYFSKVENKISSVDAKLTKQTEKYLLKLQRQEDKIKRRLTTIDSSVSTAFENSKQKYSQFSQSLFML